MTLLPLRFWPIIGTTWIGLLICYPTTAQIIPDRTLPSSSIVIPQGSTSLIEGGTTTGSNLFHSFQEFSVPTGTTAYFNNALDIQNIFTRVTGGNVSNIDGLIKANGAANLFLLNPNGIIFGQNAQLNIGGSFLATTASSYRFADGIEFSATNPQAAPLLTLSIPIGLELGANPGQIINRSRVGLQVQPERSLSLVGGDIQLEGGFLTASSGRIELGSVKDSFVFLSPNLTLGYENINNFGDIQLSGGATVNASGIGVGSIQIRGGKVTLQEGSTLLDETLGNIDSGGIDIQATQLSLTDDSFLSTTTLGEGTGGDINVSSTEKVELTGVGFHKFEQIVIIGGFSGSRRPTDRVTGFFAGTQGEGTAGNITIETPALLLQNGAAIDSSVFGSGKGGNINIRAANSVELVGSGIVNTIALRSVGAGGEIAIDTQHLIVRDASYITTTTFGSGNAGNISIKASDSVELLRAPDGIFVQTAIASNTFATGNAGDITIDTQRLIIRDGAGITSLSDSPIPGRSNAGSGGSLTVRATQEVEVSGISGLLANAIQKNSSFLNSGTYTSASGGNLSISTGRLIVKDGGVISTAALNTGRSGDLTINADRSIEIDGAIGQRRSIVEASSGSIGGNLNPRRNPEATGDGGSVTLVTPELIVSDGGLINVSSLGSGKAGTLTVVADAIRLSNGGAINASTLSGAGGNIILQTGSLQLRRQSQISTNAGNADGGNIDINTNTLAALENSDITANALSGRGGRITITAKGIFGTNARSRTELQTLLNSDNLDPSQLPTSDITAISQQDAPQLQGTVAINTPDVNPSAGLLELPVQVVDTSDRIASSCSSRRGNQFAIVGTGGLPTNPYDYLSSNTFWLEKPVFGTGENSSLTTHYPLPTTQIVEASGWTIAPDGQVTLTAAAPTVTPPSLNPPSCAVIELE
ncbi:filamentous hemagglutinin N-terminal domain-containing protein [Aerosakkonema sp. BLCC-F183]|uniref:two-partner secretion domain-containing protein n=1 Tax=Aerosakkonema sp. BLCC-F183 TaxID=3342834 RepID=UPI0035B8C502